jgi:hypothetical protein
LPEDNKPQATQSASSSSPPPRVGGAGGAGGAGERAQNTATCRSLPGSRSRSVRTSAWSFPCLRHHCRGLGGGGSPAAAVAGRGGSDGRGSSGGDKMPCFVVGCGHVVFLVWWRCELLYHIVLWA